MLVLVLFAILAQHTAPKHFNNLEAKHPIMAVTQPKPVQAAPQVSETAKVETVVAATPEAPVAAEQPQPAVTPEVEQPSVSEDAAMQAIFAHESSGNPYAINPASGSCGLGQSLPCSKLLNVCGSLDNVGCQKQWFTDYAVQRYGSTWAAWSFWQVHRWW